MEQTLKITNVLSDPTRFHIYNFIINNHKEVTVQEIADNFNIHPNVARLHLSKLEDVKMLVSETKKTGRGGRPSRLYRLSEEVIQLNFPFRDYQMLSKIAIETMLKLGEEGKVALQEIGERFGTESVEYNLERNVITEDLTFDEKIELLKQVAMTNGFYPKIETNEDEKTIYFQIYNCPFKEVALEHQEAVCGMHHSYLNGMFKSFFDKVHLEEEGNILTGCESCSYRVKLN